MIEPIMFENEPKTIKIGREQSVKGNIVYYGDNNLYPNTMETLIDSSQTAGICVKTMTDFLSTPFTVDGMGDVEVGRTITNKKYTLNQFRRDIAHSLAKFNGAFISVTKSLKGEVVSVSVLDFTKVRFSEFDDSGRSNFVYVGDWANEVIGKRGKKRVVKLPLFNNNQQVFEAQSKECNTTTQVYHIFLDDSYIYPTNAFESVAMDMDTESAIQTTRHNEVTQGSPSKLILRTDFSKDERVKAQQLEQIKKFAGPNGDKILVIKSEFDENGNPRSNNYQVDVIPDNRDISKFDSSEKSIANNIRKCVQIPGILIDFEFSTGITVSGAQLKVSVSYYNDLIRPKRDIISDSLAEIFEKSIIKFPSDDFSMVDFSMNYVE
jgi:hypothetical protein